MPSWRTTVRVEYAGGGGPGYNTFHGRTVDNTIGDDHQEMSDNLRTFYQAIIDDYAPGSRIYHDGVWSGIGDDVGKVAETTTWRIDASNIGEMLPPACSINLEWRTQRPGRTGRGRTFIGPLSRFTLGSNGDVSSTTVQRVLDAATALANTQTGPSDGALGIYSPSAGVLSDLDSARVSVDYAYLTSRRD